ncbi:hypothetical protein ACHAXH_006133, partial [Discostella pseudostelligera]
GQLGQIPLLKLALVDDFLDGAGSKHAIDVAWFSLTLAVDAGHSLQIGTWIPICIHADETIGPDQVQAASTSLRAEEEGEAMFH